MVWPQQAGPGPLEGKLEVGPSPVMGQVTQGRDHVLLFLGPKMGVRLAQRRGQ